jgi:hypothetical protein
MVLRSARPTEASIARQPANVTVHQVQQLRDEKKRSVKSHCSDDARTPLQDGAMRDREGEENEDGSTPESPLKRRRLAV